MLFISLKPAVFCNLSVGSVGCVHLLLFYRELLVALSGWRRRASPLASAGQRWAAPATFTTSSRTEACNGPSAGARNDPSPLEPVSCVVTLGSAAFGLMPREFVGCPRWCFSRAPVTAAMASTIESMPAAMAVRVAAYSWRSDESEFHGAPSPCASLFPAASNE